MAATITGRGPEVDPVELAIIASAAALEIPPAAAAAATAAARAASFERCSSS